MSTSCKSCIHLTIVFFTNKKVAGFTGQCKTYFTITVICCGVGPHYVHQVGNGCCVGRMPNLLFTVILCREYLSSGENLAGCAEMVGVPEGSCF